MRVLALLAQADDIFALLEGCNLSLSGREALQQALTCLKACLQHGSTSKRVAEAASAVSTLVTPELSPGVQSS